MCVCAVFFFFKQKTAYEMRISDWSSDVCSSDLICEIMVVTRAIGKLIQTDQTHQIPSQLQMGKDLGMQMLDQALLANVQAKEIDPDELGRASCRERVCQSV